MKAVPWLFEPENRTAILRFQRILAALIFFLFSLALFFPALGTSKFIFGTDTTAHDYVMHLYGWTKSIFGRGELPLWNPYLFSGLPMVGSAALCPFYPTQWLYLFFPFNTGFTLQYVFAVALAGTGMAWWMRSVGLNRWICLWAGFACMASGHFLTLTYAGHLQKMIAIAWAPFAFGAMAMVVRLGHLPVRQSGLPRAGVILGVALGMQLLASHPQIFYATSAACFLHLTGFAFACVPWKSLAPGAEGILLKDLARKFRPAALAILVAGAAFFACVGISAVQLFPSLEMASVSNRADGVSYQEAVETSYPPLELFEYVVPRMLGDSVRGTYTPYSGKWGERIVSDFIGLPIIILAFFGFFGSRRRYRWYLAMLLLAGVLLGLGRYTPIYRILFAILPGFDDFRSPGTFMFLANFGFIGLAALGLHVLIRVAMSLYEDGWNSSLSAPSDTTQFFETAEFRKMQRADKIRPGVTAYVSEDTEKGVFDPESEFVVPPTAIPEYQPGPNDEETVWLGRSATMIIAAAVCLVAAILGIVGMAELHGVNLEIATEAERWHYHAFVDTTSVALAIALFAGSLMVLRMKPRMGAALIALTAIGFPLFHNLYFIRFDPLSPFLVYMQRQPALEKLHRTAPQPVRMLDSHLLRDSGILHEVASVSGYHPVVLRDYTRMGSWLGIGSNAFGNLFAVNYARTDTQLPPRGGTWEQDDSFDGEYLWRRYNPSPYLFEHATVKLADNAPGADPFSSQVLAMLSPRSVSAGLIGADMIDSDAMTSGEAAIPPFLMNPNVTSYYRIHSGPQLCEALLQYWTPHEIRIHTRAYSDDPKARVLLPTAEVAAPGWHAMTADGRRVPVITVNTTQRALVIPQGEHTIRERYMPFSQRLGMFFSLLTWTVLLSFGAGSLVRRGLRLYRKIRKKSRAARKEREASAGLAGTAAPAAP